MQDYKESTNRFIQFLKGKKNYPIESLSIGKYTYGDQGYPRVEVRNDNKDIIIQSFVIMTKEQHKNNPKFPFYRTYNQKNKYDNVVNPACFIAVDKSNDENDDWEIWNAKDTKIPLYSPTLLDYQEALKRFYKRWERPGNEELYKTLRILTYVLLGALLAYLTAHLLSINDKLFGIAIPLDSTTLTILAGIAVLLILPPIMPYIKSLSFKDTKVEFDSQPQKNRKNYK